MRVPFLTIRRTVVAGLMLPLLLASLLVGAGCEIECLHPAAHSCCPAADGSSQVASTLIGAMECSHPASVLPWELVAPMALTAGFVVVQPVEQNEVPLRAQPRDLPGAGPPIFPLRI